MTDQSQSPATKKDVKLLMEQMGKFYERTHREMLDVKEGLVTEMDRKISASEDRIKHYFDVVAENIKHDFLRGALPDKIEQHEDRIIRLEQHAGFAA